MNNILSFNQACAIVFTRLYESFPLAVNFDQREMGFYNRNDISEEANRLRKIFHETLIFLKEEGFITFDFDPEGNVTVNNARLTSKGLLKLQRLPDGIKEESKSLINQLRDAVGSTGEKATAAALAEAVKHFIALILS